MTIRAVPHIPSWFDTGHPPPEATADSIQELLSVDWIRRIAAGEIFTDRAFHQWSLSDNCLIAEFDGGEFWWVVAYLTSDEPIPLPEWHSRCA